MKGVIEVHVKIPEMARDRLRGKVSRVLFRLAARLGAVDIRIYTTVVDLDDDAYFEGNAPGEAAATVTPVSLFSAN